MPDLNDVYVLEVMTDQVDGQWDLIQRAAQCAVGDLDEEGWAQVHRDLKRGSLLAHWIVGKDKDGTNHALQLVLSQPGQDRFTGEKTLHILALYGYQRMSLDQYRQVWGYLERVAHSLGVRRVTCLSDEPDIVNLLTEKGARAATHWTLDLKENTNGTHV